MNHTTSDNKLVNEGDALEEIILAATEDGKSYALVGNTTQAYEIVPPSGGYLIVKGMYISGEGNNGKSTIEGSTGRILLPLYHTIQNQATPSGRTNIKLDVDETILLRTTGRVVTNETFFGVSVIVVKE